MSNLNNFEQTQSRVALFEKLALVKSTLEIRLSEPRHSSKMQHGQIKRAANFTLRKLGHEWIVYLHVNKTDNFRIYMELEKTVKTTVGAWHKNPSRVWYEFSNYYSELGAGIATRNSLKKFTLK